MQRWDVVTFDCYGTLIDWERGIREAFRTAAAAAGFALDVDAAVAAYLEIERDVEAETFRRYRDLLAETARRVAARLGWQLPEARADFLAESLPRWPPFADTNPALERLATAGYRLGILSNVDDDLLAGTRRHFTVEFAPDLIVTAEQVRSYKPAPGHFETARRRIGDVPWLHAAQSFFHDVVPARRHGIPIAWINRNGQVARDGITPDKELRTLADLADWLAYGNGGPRYGPIPPKRS
jgi:2-haloalkanoic acid dehalogenase type II